MRAPVDSGCRPVSRPVESLRAVAAVVVLFGGPGAILAQSGQESAERRFEVASVKRALSPAELGRAAAASGGTFSMPRFGIQTQPGGRFTAFTVTLKQLVAEAFEVRDYQIDGGPKWLTSDYFDVVANAGAEASPADVRSMLRVLLAERFGLRTHTETRQAPVHVLTLARADGRLGPRLKRTTPECEKQIHDRKNGIAAPRPTSPPPNLREFPTTPTCGSTMMMARADGASSMLWGGMELSSLVRHISSEVAGPVDDRTGLSGLFDISLEYTSDRRLGGRAPGLDPNSTDIPPPILVPALQQQLGLKLDKQIGPMPVVVIDAAESPTPD